MTSDYRHHIASSNCCTHRDQHCRRMGYIPHRLHPRVDSNKMSCWPSSSLASLNLSLSTCSILSLQIAQLLHNSITWYMMHATWECEACVHHNLVLVCDRSPHLHAHTQSTLWHNRHRRLGGTWDCTRGAMPISFAVRPIMRSAISGQSARKRPHSYGIPDCKSQQRHSQGHSRGLSHSPSHSLSLALARTRLQEVHTFTFSSSHRKNAYHSQYYSHAMCAGGGGGGGGGNLHGGGAHLKVCIHCCFVSFKGRVCLQVSTGSLAYCAVVVVAMPPSSATASSSIAMIISCSHRPVRATARARR